VSRTINRPELVVADVQARILRAMSELDYQPNRHARAMGGVQSRTVGLLFFRDLWDLVVNPFWATATSTVYNSLLSREIDCNLISLGGSAARERFRSAEAYEVFFRTRNVDGFLLVGPVSREHEEFFSRSEIPAVMWGRPTNTESRLLHFDSDNVSGAASAIDHLVERGRRVIGTITGDMSIISARDRYEGYVWGLGRHSLRLDPSLVEAGDFSRSSGANAMLKLLHAHPELDAVFVANDEMAIGAWEVANASGRRVPEDVAIVGFDNASLPEWRDISLTSVSPSYEAIGDALVVGLTALMAGEPAESGLIATHLVLGQTS
jgi:LacI family transcriptional regulator